MCVVSNRLWFSLVLVFTSSGSKRLWFWWRFEQVVVLSGCGSYRFCVCPRRRSGSNLRELVGFCSPLLKRAGLVSGYVSSLCYYNLQRYVQPLGKKNAQIQQQTVWRSVWATCPCQTLTVSCRWDCLVLRPPGGAHHVGAAVADGRLHAPVL